MDISIKWRNPALAKQEQWVTFPIADIMHRSRDYAVALFSRSILVVIKQGDLIISNSMEMRNLYKKKGFKVYDLASVQPDENALGQVGFI